MAQPLLRGCIFQGLTMKVVLLSCLMFVCSLALADGAPTETAPSAVQRLASANSAIQAKNWSAAITELKAVVKEDPHLALGWLTAMLNSSGLLTIRAISRWL